MNKICRLFHSKLALKRDVKSLRYSAEALRQLRMGRDLDPHNAIAPTVPILEEIFDDQDLYIAQNADRDAKYPFVTPESPWARTGSEVKGCNALAVSTLFSYRIIKACGTKMDFKSLGAAFYFPPWHPIAQMRKSRPALIALRGPGEQFNGSKAAQQLATRKSQRSMNPLDYAVWRLTATRRYRRALLENCKIDGLYGIIIRKVPTLEEARSLMAKFTDRVNKSNFDWVDKQAKALRLGELHRSIERTHGITLQTFKDKAAWNLEKPAEHAERSSE